MAPDGVEWEVGRRWLARRPRWRQPKIGGPTTEAAAVGLEDPRLLLLAFIVVVVAIPLLLFLLELAVALAIIALVFVARVVLRRPWIVEARSSQPEQVLRWKVVGWRRSGEVAEEIARVLEAGGRDFQSPYATRV